MVRFHTYSAFHGKNELVGSDFIRVQQLFKYWPEAGMYKYGEKPDALIFTKVFTTQDYKFPKHFPGIKILDICDPMWLEGCSVVETAQAMDAVTCPTEPLANFMRQFHTNIHIIKDRFDIDNLPEPKRHSEPAKTVVWFGYPQNAELLKPAIGKIDELKLNLIIISGEDPIANRWSTRKPEEFYKYIKHPNKGDELYMELQRADFAILPDGNRPQDYFKSENKTIRANLAGLPVAKTAEDVDLYMKPENRRKWFDENYSTIKEQYDIRKSVAQYRAIINEAASKRH